MMNAKLPLLVALLGLGGGIIWLQLQSRVSEEMARVEPGASRQKSLDNKPAIATAIETPSAPESRTDALAPQVELARTNAAAIEVDLALKYADLSVEQLDQASNSVFQSFRKSSGEAFRLRMRQGHFVQQVLSADQPAPDQIGVCLTSEEDAGEGRIRYKTVTLPADEFPEVNSLYAEMSWLETRTRTLRAESRR